MVVCGGFVVADGHPDMITNPSVVVEVLSESTERWDRGGKFAQYRRVASLMEYVLVSQYSPLVEVFYREAAGSNWWQISTCSDLGGSILLQSLNLRIPLSDIYEGIELDEPEELSGEA